MNGPITGPATTPLLGLRVLIGRPAGRGRQLAGRLTDLGGEPLHVPLTRIAPPADPQLLDAAIAQLGSGRYGWVGFTSVPAVDAVVPVAAPDRPTSPAPRSPVIPASTRVAAVGPATGHALRTAGVPVDLVPPGPGSSAALGAAWPRPERPDDRVLLPRSASAPDELPDALRAKGFQVDCVVAYRTVVVPLAGPVADALRRGDMDAVILTSGSSVTALADVRLPSSVIVVAIGAPTAAAAAAAGLEPVVAAAPTDDAVVAALLDAVAERGGSRTGPASRTSESSEDVKN